MPPFITRSQNRLPTSCGSIAAPAMQTSSEMRRRSPIGACRLHPVTALRRIARGRCEPREKRLRGLRVLCTDADGCCKRRRRLDLAWQRADDVDAGLVRQLAQLLKAELDVAAGDQRGNRNAGRC